MADGYSIEFDTSAAKALKSVQRADQVRIAKAMMALMTDPRPNGCTKLSGTASAYRIRIGVYRVVYLIDDAIRIITITRIGHRREVYR